MTKKSLIFTLILLALAAGIWWVSSLEKDDATQATDLTDFSYQEVENINRIFFGNKSGKHIDLVRVEPGKWTVNKEHTAWQKKVDFLLYETFGKIKIKGTVPKPALDNVIKNLTIAGIKVEIYAENIEEPVQVYYVGGSTPDQLGTYFWKPEAETPYIMYVPGFTGYLNSRFDLQERNWISRTLFAYEKEDVQSINVSFKDYQYSIDKLDSNFVLKDASGKMVNANPNAVNSYVSYFKRLNMESIIDLVEYKQDSILKTKPLAVLSVTDTKGETKTLSLYQKPSHDKMHNLHTDEGERLTYDPNRYYAKMSDAPEWMIVQEYTFGKVLRTPQEFQEK